MTPFRNKVIEPWCAQLFNKHPRALSRVLLALWTQFVIQSSSRQASCSTGRRRRESPREAPGNPQNQTQLQPVERARNNIWEKSNISF
ncbi:hypothetical protein CHARACLAT_005910 [Characodon lateralis]|uniref:Uncharacterized protein n=1 Tax=Characodon lateralis TaxID=208331 RepID=A0ABU7EHA5_9TELE|nr:hypothetical protein [Characodon lateralis]